LRSLLLLFVCLGTAAQTIVPPGKSADRSQASAAKNLSPEAELALDAAQRWTQTTLQDTSNLLPIQRDMVLVHLAGKWNPLDHPRAEQYATEAVDRIWKDADAAVKAGFGNANSQVMLASHDVLTVDRKLWDHLVDGAPPGSASEFASIEAEQQASEGDVPGALELARKSLAKGGSMNEAQTLDQLVQKDTAAAAQLFDDILSTALKPDSDSNLLTGLTQDVFSNHVDATGQSFFDEARQRQLLDILAQRSLAGEENGACNYTWEAARLLSRYPAALQGQLQPAIAACQKRPEDSAVENLELKHLESTDDIVRAMNEASEAKMKTALRERAIRRAADTDHDYERAVRLCLEITDEERTGVLREPGTLGDRFDRWAMDNVSRGISAAIRRGHDAEMQRLLDLLPPRLKAQPELTAARMLEWTNKPRAMLLLAEARAILEHETPVRPSPYFQLLGESARLAPSDIGLAWHVLGTGLNRFDQARRNQLQVAVLSGTKTKQRKYLTSIDDTMIPTNAVPDESLVRAVIDDVDSPETRASLRLSVIGVFLQRYNELLQPQSNSRTP
jgi:hypothetical protein